MRISDWSSDVCSSDLPLNARFNPKASDARWQRVWEENRTFVANDGSAKPRTYVLEMFPYPSGRIHMGHVRNYTMGDGIARYRLATGYRVQRGRAAGRGRGGPDG